MLNTATLSLDQAPPISIPFRFFLTAPLFGVIAALFLIVEGPSLLVTRWSPLTLGLTHLITLGFLAMVMCGALLQMLPVIAGSPVPRVVLVGTLCHMLLTAGSGLLVFAFISGHAMSQFIALGLLGLTVILFFIALAVALWRVRQVSHTVIAMRLALFSLLITLLLGVLLGSGLLGQFGFSHLAALVDVHLGWGILGWVGLLLVGISYQVVPMFQVTPEYPMMLRKWLVPALFGGLLLWSGLTFAALSGLLPMGIMSLSMVPLLAGFVIFAFQTLHLQKQRKRRIPDVTMGFWRLGMIFIVISVLLWLAGQWVEFIGQDPRYHLLLGVSLLLGVGVSVVNGMLYKIVPFLSWFHLQNRQLSLMCMTVQVPNMKQFISDKQARLQYRLFLGSLILSLAAAVVPVWFAHAAGLLFILSNLLLLKNLASAMVKFRQTQQALQRFADTSSPPVTR